MYDPPVEIPSEPPSHKSLPNTQVLSCGAGQAVQSSPASPSPTPPLSEAFGMWVHPEDTFNKGHLLRSRTNQMVGFFFF